MNHEKGRERRDPTRPGSAEPTSPQPPAAACSRLSSCAPPRPPQPYRPGATPAAASIGRAESYGDFHWSSALSVCLREWTVEEERREK